MRELLRFSGTVVWGGLGLGYGKGNLVKHSNVKPQKHVISHSKVQKHHLATRTTKSVTHSETLKCHPVFKTTKTCHPALATTKKLESFFHVFEDYFHSFFLS